MNSEDIAVPTQRSPTFGFGQYKNSPTLSDITIRYGPGGERTFYGHKIILCKSSRWFQTAFTKTFTESTDKELVLQDDDPIALEVLLALDYDEAGGQEYVYRYLDHLGLDPKEHFGILKERDPDDLKILLTILNIAEVADKYDCPKLLDLAAYCFERVFGLWMNEVSQNFSEWTSIHDQLTERYHPELLGIVQSVYKWASNRRNLILNPILEFGRLATTTYELCTCPVPLVEDLQKLVLGVSEEIPEFGRDILHSFHEFDNSPSVTPLRARAVCFICKNKTPEGRDAK